MTYCLWDELPGCRGAWDIRGVEWGELALIREWRCLLAGTEANWWLTCFSETHEIAQKVKL